MLLHLLLSCLFMVRAEARDSVAVARATLKRQQAAVQLIESELDSFLPLLEDGKPIFSSNDILELLRKSELSEVTEECSEDLQLMINSVLRPVNKSAFRRHVLLPMKDSGGRVGPAIMRAHIYFKGHYSECKGVDFAVEGRQRNFRADIFRFDLDFFLRPNSDNNSCAINLLPGFDLYWQVDVCLPASCSSVDLRHIFRPENGSHIDNPVCVVTRTADSIPDPDAGFYVTVAVMGVIVAVCILAGIVDYFFAKQLEHTPITKTLAWHLFMSCSLYTNITSILEEADTGKSDQIAPIACMRFFSMCFVLMGHLFSNYISITANMADLRSLTKDITTEIIINSMFAVDTFFFIGGVLLAYLWTKSYNRQPKETMSVYGWIMFYVHRILRLSPAFYIMVLFYSFVFKQMFRDSPLSMNDAVLKDYCSITWWIELLYLHNFVQHDEWCIAWGWYLAVDMQMYIFTPLLLIPLAIKPAIGFIVAALFFIASTGINIFFVYHYHWPAAESFVYTPDPEETNMENYNMIMYQSPVIRCQIYIMGLLVGWFLQTKKQMRIHPVIYLTSWVIGLSLMLTVLLGLHDQTNGFLIPIFWRAMYSALSRPAWGLGLTVILVMCYYGYGGPISSFMSWNIWVPLGRLSYCGYLIHYPIMMLVLGQSKDEDYFSNFIGFFITRVVSLVATTYFFALFWSACFEISFGRIEKLLLMGGGKAKKFEDKSPKAEFKAENEVPWASDNETADSASERVRL